MADLRSQSEEDLTAALQLLQERIHQWTMACEKIRAELVIHQLAGDDLLSDLSRMQSLAGSRPDPEKHSTYDQEGEKAVEWALKGAPARVKLIAERRTAVENLLVAIPEDLREAARPRLEAVPGNGPLPEDFVEDFMRPVKELVASRARAAMAAGERSTQEAVTELGS